MCNVLRERDFYLFIYYFVRFFPGDAATLEQPAVLEVVLDDDVGDRVEDEADVVGICGTGEVRVDLLHVLALVQVLKFKLDVVGAILVALGA